MRLQGKIIWGKPRPLAVVSPRMQITEPGTGCLLLLKSVTETFPLIYGHPPMVGETHRSLSFSLAPLPLSAYFVIFRGTDAIEIGLFMSQEKIGDGKNEEKL